MCVYIHVYVPSVDIWVSIYLRICTQSLGGCVYGYVYTHKVCMCLCTYLRIGTQSLVCVGVYICVYVRRVYMGMCIHRMIVSAYTQVRGTG